jgi:hypothetical protein
MGESLHSYPSLTVDVNVNIVYVKFFVPVNQCNSVSTKIAGKSRKQENQDEELRFSQPLYSL